MKKKKNIFKNKSFYISLLLFITTIFLVFSIFNIGILSVKYLIPIILVILIIDLLLIVFTNKNYKYKENKKKKLSKNELIDDKVEFEKKVKRKRFLLNILTIIISFIYLTIGIVTIQIANSMNNLFKNNSTINYSVIVNKSSGYKEIKDINDKIVGFYQEDKYNESAEEKLSKSVDCDFIGYSTINDLKYALRNDDVDAIMIMDSYLELDNDSDLEEIETDDIENTSVNSNDDKLLKMIEDFDQKTKKIFSFKINIDNSKNTKSIDLEKGSFVVYISGQDSYASEVSETSRSDVNMLAVVNIKTREVLLLTIPRDYYIKIKSKGAYDKLTHISLYGSEEAANSLGALLDVDVDYYVKFNFTTFMKATEYLLPLDVYSDYEFTTSVYDQTIGDCFTYYKGFNHITSGKQALQFVRARKNFAQGDRQRGINQTRFLRAVINKATTPSVLVKYNKIMESLEGTFLTNIDNESIINIIKYALNHNGKYNISSISLDGSDANRSTYSGGSQGLYVMIPNQKTIDTAKIAIQDVLDGKKPDVEIDASETADKKDVHSVSKAPTNYGTTSNYVPVKKEDLNKEEEKKEDIKEESENDDDSKNEDSNDSADVSDNDNKEDDSTSTDQPVQPEPTPTPSPSPLPETGSTVPSSEDIIIE